MDKKEILHNAYNALKNAGIVESRKDFTDKLLYDYTSFSSAWNGAERYLTKRLFQRIARAFPELNPTYLLKGTGEVMRSVTPDLPGQERPDQEMDGDLMEVVRDLRKAIGEMEEQREQTERALEQNRKAMEQIDQLIEIIRKISAK